MHRVIRFLRELDRQVTNDENAIGKYVALMSVIALYGALASLGTPGDIGLTYGQAPKWTSDLFWFVAVLPSLTFVIWMTFAVLALYLRHVIGVIPDIARSLRKSYSKTLEAWRESAEKQKRDAKRKVGYDYDPYETAPQYKKIKCARCQDTKRVKCPDCNGHSSLDADNYCGRCEATHEIECKKCKPLKPGTMTIRKG